MSERVYRLLAVVRADVLIRMRRPSTAVVFVLLSAIPYFWIPDPATGRALIQIDGSRALYNSAAIGLATATLGSIFIGLFGFYVISNAVRRDVLSRCGFVIASTTMRGSEYIAGKFAGNVAFLTIFAAGYMAVSMAMVVVRGEAPLEPLVFATQYALLLPPAITFVSAIAMLFECTPILRTRFGDVLYFFLWLGIMGMVASTTGKENASRWPHYFDIAGLGFIMEQVKSAYGTESLAIGATSFDASKPPLVFAGLRFDGGWLLPRLGSTLTPLSLLLLARLFFHRFDPARVRAGGEKSRTSWLGRLNALSRPIARIFLRVGDLVVMLPGRASLIRSAMTDALATLAAFPLAILVMAGFSIAALNADAASLRQGVLPFAFAACALVLAGIAPREKREGTLGLVFAAPGIRDRFVWWKFLSALLAGVVCLGIPIGKAIALSAVPAMPLLVGFLFMVAAATAIGILSSNPKAFVVLFLLFWYVVLSDKGSSPELDFAGWAGVATPSISAAYAAISVALLILAQLFHARELRRSW
ncbi:MAG TPA: hypothetical protein VF701_04450 [Thermoanaerobaculia bacterium]